MTHDFDAVGRVKGLSGPANKWYAGTPADPIRYAPHGQMDHLLLGNGVVETRHFNGKLQPVSIQASALLTLSYDFGEGSNNGNIQSQTIAAPKSAGGMLTLRQDYAYDALNRLESTKESVTGEIGERWRLWHQYDQFGNQWVDVGAWKTNIPLNFATPTGQAQYNSANNRLRKNAAGVDLPANAYDVAGNLLNHPYMSGPAVYDAENRLTSVGTTATFTYDGEGRRVKKRVSGGATTVYVYDASGQVAAEYITGGAQPASGTQYVTADYLGSTRLVTDQSGAVVSRKDYFPFGEEIPANETHGSRQLVAGYGAPSGVKDLFTGKERDAETGLDYFGVRYFSAAQGRWTSPDPNLEFARIIPNPQGWNRYAYVLNNPLRYIDPDGEAEREVAYDGYVKVGGHRSWRNNNPGNLIYTPWSKRQGATGPDYGGMAIFPTPEAVEAARQALWELPRYQNLTLAAAVAEYAPPNENDTAKYVAELAKAMGASPNTMVKSLTPDQMQRLLAAQLKLEGQKPGRELLLPGPALTPAMLPPIPVLPLPVQPLPPPPPPPEPAKPEVDNR